jgi:hypothetical protein
MSNNMLATATSIEGLKPVKTDIKVCYNLYRFPNDPSNTSPLTLLHTYLYRMVSIQYL